MKVKLGLLYIVGYVCLYAAYAHVGSDLCAPWYGSRALMQRHNPYAPNVTQQIQIYYYGRPLLRGDEQRFAYPAYASLLLLPVLMFRFPVAQVVMVVLSVLAMCVLVWISIRMVRAVSPSGPPLPYPLISILTLISPPVLCGLWLQQVALLVQLLIIAALWMVTRKKYLAGGALLAVATSKPQLALIPVLWLMVWALSQWKDRWRLIFSFALSLFLLVAYGAWFAGLGWTIEWLKCLRAYRNYAHGAVSILELISGSRFGIFVTAFAMSCLLLYMVVQRKVDPDSRQFLEVSCLLLALSLLVVPTLLSLFNYVLLLPGILLTVTRKRFVVAQT